MASSEAASGSHAAPGSSRSASSVLPKLTSALACRGVEAPVDQRDDGLDVEEDDRRTAGAAEHIAQTAVLAEHDGRVHGAARPLAAPRRDWRRAGPPRRSAAKEKSVSWLLSRKPRTMVRAPKAYSMLVVMEKALPSSSTMEIWLVPLALSRAVVAEGALLALGGEPAVTAFAARARDRSGRGARRDKSDRAARRRARRRNRGSAR